MILFQAHAAPDSQQVQQKPPNPFETPKAEAPKPKTKKKGVVPKKTEQKEEKPASTQLQKVVPKKRAVEAEELANDLVRAYMALLNSPDRADLLSAFRSYKTRFDKAPGDKLKTDAAEMVAEKLGITFEKISETITIEGKEKTFYFPIEYLAGEAENIPAAYEKLRGALRNPEIFTKTKSELLNDSRYKNITPELCSRLYGNRNLLADVSEMLADRSFMNAREEYRKDKRFDHTVFSFDILAQYAFLTATKEALRKSDMWNPTEVNRIMKLAPDINEAGRPEFFLHALPSIILLYPASMEQLMLKCAVTDDIIESRYSNDGRAWINEVMRNYYKGIPDALNRVVNNKGLAIVDQMKWSTDERDFRIKTEADRVRERVQQMPKISPSDLLNPYTYQELPLGYYGAERFFSSFGLRMLPVNYAPPISPIRYGPLEGALEAIGDITGLEARVYRTRFGRIETGTKDWWSWNDAERTKMTNEVYGKLLGAYSNFMFDAQGQLDSGTYKLASIRNSGQNLTWPELLTVRNYSIEFVKDDHIKGELDNMLTAFSDVKNVSGEEFYRTTPGPQMLAVYRYNYATHNYNGDIFVKEGNNWIRCMPEGVGNAPNIINKLYSRVHYDPYFDGRAKWQEGMSEGFILTGNMDPAAVGALRDAAANRTGPVDMAAFLATSAKDRKYEADARFFNVSNIRSLAVTARDRNTEIALSSSLGRGEHPEAEFGKSQHSAMGRRFFEKDYAEAAWYKTIVNDLDERGGAAYFKRASDKERDFYGYLVASAIATQNGFRTSEISRVQVYDSEVQLSHYGETGAGKTTTASVDWRNKTLEYAKSYPTALFGNPNYEAFNSIAYFKGAQSDIYVGAMAAKKQLTGLEMDEFRLAGRATSLGAGVIWSSRLGDLAGTMRSTVFAEDKKGAGWVVGGMKVTPSQWRWIMLTTGEASTTPTNLQLTQDRLKQLKFNIGLYNRIRNDGEFFLIYDQKTGSTSLVEKSQFKLTGGASYIHVTKNSDVYRIGGTLSGEIENIRRQGAGLEEKMAQSLDASFTMNEKWGATTKYTLKRTATPASRVGEGTFEFSFFYNF